MPSQKKRACVEPEFGRGFCLLVLLIYLLINFSHFLVLGNFSGACFDHIHPIPSLLQDLLPFFTNPTLCHPFLV